MIIERLELENWMSYPRRWAGGGPSGDGEIVPTIDLTTESLILIAGDNGAGKSAILEAICYALFANYPRGKNPDAIRSGEKTAIVRLTFSLPSASGKARYRVERQLTTKASGINAKLIQISDNGPEVSLTVGQSAVTDYIQDVLLGGVTYDTFVSTIFLRQDAAGKFMGLSPEEQGEQLLHLCHLEIYHQIHKKAESLRKNSENTVKSLQERFARVEYATEAHLSTRREEAQKLSKKQRELREQEKVADNLLQQVKRIATLGREIEGLEQKLDEWCNILEQADKIRHAHQWQIAWQRVKNLLGQGQEKHSGLQNRKVKIEQKKLDLKAAKGEAERLATEHNALQEQYSEKNELLSQLKDNLPTLISEKEIAERNLQEAKQAKKLDEDIARIMQEQADRKIKLADFDEVRRKRDYASLLGHAQTALKYTLEKLNDVQAEQKTVEDKEAEAQTAANTSAELQEIVGAKKKTLKELEEKAKTLGEEAVKSGRQIGQAEDIIENRTKAFEAGKCPVCGIEMIGDVGQHVQQEISNLQEQISVLSQQLSAVNDELATFRSEIERLALEIANQEDEVRRLNSQEKAAKETSEKAAKRATEYRASANNHWQKHLTTWQDISLPDWFTKPSVEMEANIEQALTELKGVESKYNELTETQAHFNSEATLLQKYESSRAELLVVSPISEAQVVALEEAFKDAQKRLEVEEEKRDNLAKEVRLLEGQVRDLSGKLEDARNKVNDIDKLLSNLETSQENDQENLTKIWATLQSEQQQLEVQFPDLASDLLRAIDDPEANDHLEVLAKRYANDAGQLKELQKAETESVKVETEIALKRKELNLLLTEVGEISEGEASEKLARLQKELEELDQKVANANTEVGNIEAHYQERLEVEPQLSKAKKENWAYRTIEEAIYPGTKTKSAGRLWTQITQKLMESIGEEATQILKSLGWPIAVAYSEKAGFCIKDKTFSDVTRKYVEFSGGERFAIAIAVALAIGQVTHGAGNVRCLFIDEGFGSLDTKNRGRITTDAIGKLIERGWRDQVVVITHLEDMKGFFPHHISLVRKDDCSCLVSPEEELV